MTINLNLSDITTHFAMGVTGCLFGSLLYYKITHVTEYCYNKNGTNYEKIPSICVSDDDLKHLKGEHVIVSRGYQYPITQQLPKRILLCAISSGLMSLIPKHSSLLITMFRLCSITSILVLTLFDIGYDIVSNTFLDKTSKDMRNIKWVRLTNEEVKAREINAKKISEFAVSASTYFNWYRVPRSVYRCPFTITIVHRIDAP